MTLDVPYESEQTADRRRVITSVVEVTPEEVIQLRNDTQTSLKSEMITILVILLTLLTGKYLIQTSTDGWWEYLICDDILLTGKLYVQ